MFASRSAESEAKKRTGYEAENHRQWIAQASKAAPSSTGPVMMARMKRRPNTGAPATMERIRWHEPKNDKG